MISIKNLLAVTALMTGGAFISCGNSQKNSQQIEESEAAIVQALAAFRDSEPGSFDAILMDVMMPEMDGLEAAKAIRALDRPDAKTIPIIAMTANVFKEDREKCLAAGMNAHLSKPLDAETMKRTISEQLKKLN